MRCGLFLLRTESHNERSEAGLCENSVEGREHNVTREWEFVLVEEKVLEQDAICHAHAQKNMVVRLWRGASASVLRRAFVEERTRRTVYGAFE